MFDEAKFTQVLTASAAQVLKVAPAAVPLDWMSILTGLLGSLFSSCLGGTTPTPPASSADVATQLKNANVIQRSVLRQRIRKAYVQAGKTRKDGDDAYATVEHAVATTSHDDLTSAIEHARQDAAMIPDFEMN